MSSRTANNPGAEKNSGPHIMFNEDRQQFRVARVSIVKRDDGTRMTGARLGQLIELHDVADPSQVREMLIQRLGRRIVVGKDSHTVAPQ